MCLKQYLGYCKQHIRIYYYICNCICPQNRSCPCWPLGFPGSSDGKEPASILKTWVKKIPWKREWLPTPVLFFFFFLFLIGGKLLYNNVVVFPILRHKSAMGVHVFPHPELPFHPPSPLHPSGLSQSTGYECPA